MMIHIKSDDTSIRSNTIEFQKNLKLNDILLDTRNNNDYYKFMGFSECKWMGLGSCGSCKECKGKYKLKNLKNNETHICCFDFDEYTYLYKMEEFISEEEFSI